MQMNDKEFDQIVRSMMMDAEEEVPSRVWSSVSSQIGKASSTKVVALNWKRISAGVAAAAAIVAGVFIFNRPTISQTNTETDMVADLSVDRNASQAVPVFDAIPSGKGSENLIAQSAPSRNYGAAAQSAILPAEDDAVSVGTEAIVNTPETKDAEMAEPAERTSRREENSVEGPVSAADPFAQMAFEDSQRPERHGVSFKIGGDVSTNSGAAGVSHSRMSRPGDTQHSITQISKESSYSVPISFGLGIRVPMTGKWSVETGLTYSFLERTFTGVYREAVEGAPDTVINGDIRSSLHYVGIPVNFTYDILSGRKTQFYAFAGGAVERAVVNRFRIPGPTEPIFYKESVNGVQASATAGLGVNFLITDNLGFYIDPSVKYYFDCKQPVSIRTQQRLMMNLELGFRFNL